MSGVGARAEGEDCGSCDEGCVPVGGGVCPARGPGCGGGVRGAGTCGEVLGGAGAGASACDDGCPAPALLTSSPSCGPWSSCCRWGWHQGGGRGQLSASAWRKEIYTTFNFVFSVWLNGAAVLHCSKKISDLKTSLGPFCIFFFFCIILYKCLLSTGQFANPVLGWTFFLKLELCYHHRCKSGVFLFIFTHSSLQYSSLWLGGKLLVNIHFSSLCHRFLEYYFIAYKNVQPFMRYKSLSQALFCCVSPVSWLRGREHLLKMTRQVAS